MPDLWEHECAAWAQGYETVCGVDEAGAGPLMGPVYGGGGHPAARLRDRRAK